jgi:hypothetical protein
MEDEFLHKFRKEPRPEFSKSLYEKIKGKGYQPMNSQPRNLRLLTSWKMALAGVAAVLAVALVVSPSARALAQDFLNLFRVKRFAAISVDQARIEQLQAGNVDLKDLIGSSTEVLKDPGKPQVVESPAAAAQLAGIPVRVPTTLPNGLTLNEIRVQGDGIVRVKADTAKIQGLVDTLGLTDVKIPEQLNGATVTINKPAMVVMEYNHGGAKGDRVMFVQSHNPQIELPSGVDLPQLGEIALRIVGMAPDEAHRFAQSIDWTSTLLVPVPANASSFREVEVRGTTGLLVTTSGSGTLNTPKGPMTIPQGSMLVWAEGDMVYAMNGTGSIALVDMANSLQ